MRILRESVGVVVAAAITGFTFFTPLVVAFSVANPDIIEMAQPDVDRVVTLSMEALEGMRDVAPPSDPENLAEQLTWEPEPEPVAAEPVAAEPVATKPAEPAEPAEATEAASTAGKTAPASELTSTKTVEATLAANAARKTPAKTAEPKVEASERTPPIRTDAVVAKAERVPVRPATKPATEPAPPTIRTAHDLKMAAVPEEKCGVPHPDINRVEKGNFIVQRSLIDFYTSSMARFNSLGWSKRYDSDKDEHKGWYISGFGCKSPLWKGGLRPRDIVQSVNNRKTYNVVQIFALWTTMRKKGDFEVKVIRKGQEILIHYKVV